MRAALVLPRSQQTSQETSAACGMSTCAVVASLRCSREAGDVVMRTYGKTPEVTAQYKKYFSFKTKGTSETFRNKCFLYTLSNEVKHVF